MNKNIEAVKKNIYEFIKYTLVSGIALAVDYASYWILVFNRYLDLPKAAVIGYTIGLFVAYFSISKQVFKNGWLRERKRLEGFLFLLSGLFGITLTYIVVKVVVLFFGERINLAKIFRKFIVFKSWL